MTATRTQVLRLEGGNFASTLYDTNNLSVIRGASLKLGEIGQIGQDALKNVGIEKFEQIYSGASQAAFTFDGTEEQAVRAVKEARNALGEGMWQHLSVSVAFGDSLEQAEARSRASQFRSWTIPACHNGRAEIPDRFDKVRGATVKVNKGENQVWVSESVKARLEHGRDHRSQFFSSRLGNTLPRNIHFCESFQDIIKGTPKNIPNTIHNKLALVHLDGDNFGTIAREVGLAPFNKVVIQKLDEVLKALVEHACKLEEEEFLDDDPFLRLEMLVWGGDDITLVMPAWRLLGFMETFYNAIRGWNIDGHSLSFTGGSIIAHYKSPVRQLVKLASEAVDASKTAGARGCFTIDIFESAALPEDGLEKHRHRVFTGGVTTDMIAFPGDEAHTLRERLNEWQTKDDLPSISKIHGMLEPTARTGLLSQQANDQLSIELSTYSQRVLNHTEPGCTAWLPCRPNAMGSLRPLALELALLASLWHYAERAME